MTTMNALTLRTHTINVNADSSSSRASSWTPPKRNTVARRAFRPVFISSPAPRRSHLRVRRAA